MTITQILFTVYTHNGFGEAIRLKRAPLFKTEKEAQAWLDKYDYKEYCWVEAILR